MNVPNPMDLPRPIQEGWVCPRCGRVNSPSAPYCFSQCHIKVEVKTMSKEDFLKQIKKKKPGKDDWDYLKGLGIDPPEGDDD